MSGWSDSELTTIGTADEIHIAPDRADHTPARPYRSGWSASVTICMSGPTAVPPAAGIAAPGAMAADGSVSAASTMRSGSSRPTQTSGRRSTLTLVDFNGQTLMVVKRWSNA